MTDERIPYDEVETDDLAAFANTTIEVGDSSFRVEEPTANQIDMAFATGELEITLYPDHESGGSIVPFRCLECEHFPVKADMTAAREPSVRCPECGWFHELPDDRTELEATFDIKDP